MKRRTTKKAVEQCIELFRANGLETTGPVQRALEVFFSSTSPIGLKDLERSALEGDTGVSTMEIKRILKHLVTYGFAQEQVGADGVTRYESTHLDEYGNELLCLKCGAVAEFSSVDLEDLQQQQASRAGFRAFSHQLQILGLCKKCASKAGESLVPLAAVAPGGKFRIVEIRGFEGQKVGHWGGKRRLAELGIAPDMCGEVVSNSGLMFVVQMGGSKLALRQGQAQKILVSVTD